MPLAFINDQKLPLKSIAGTFEWIIIFGPNRFKCGSHIFRSVLKMFPDIFNSVIFPHTWPAVKLSLSDIRLLVSNCAKLKTLNLTYTTLPNRGILELMGNLDQLEALWLVSSFSF